MPLRDFFARHRIATAVIAPATLGVVAIVAATWAISAPGRDDATQLTSSVTECHDMVTISVAGRNDAPAEDSTKLLVDADGKPLPAALAGDHNSEWVDPVVNAPDGAVDPDSYAAVYIAYPADMSSYEAAVETGVANTKQVMTEISAACPDTRFAIVGYSEGADVVRRVAMEIGNQQPGADGEYGIVDPADVVGVVILADSGRSPGDGPFIGADNACSNPDGFDQKYQGATCTPADGQGAVAGTLGGFGALDGKIASFCSDGDLTCAAPENISLLQLVVNVGRQLDVDRLQAEGLTPATGGDVAVALGRIALAAFADIQAQGLGTWMQSDETFLDVLLRVSDPQYDPKAAPQKPAKADAIASDKLSPLAYLPQKILDEIVGLIATNENTIPVVMSDPYQLTLGPDHTGHHFDYWDDADPNNDRPLTSAQYAAAWLTHLAKQAQAGEPVETKAKPQPEDFATVQAAVQSTTAKPTATTTPKPTGTTTTPTTTPGTTNPGAAAVTTTPPAAATTTPQVAEPPTTTPPAPTTTGSVTTTTGSATSTTTAAR
ncbi:cutinase family protein [Nocardia asteroides]|uniref:cutinase family protein n=1 Tax=Nocardia asteroides TaxID=1824 RepID=UPI001E4F668F|nr:cutinase family protein [Nocardia asteroides]UGT62335.1 cutinase family protein [Nocardia asteroides]